MPSIGHFILQQAVQHGAQRSRGRLPPALAAGSLQHRPLPPALLATRPLLAKPPLFDLRGLVIGSGLTDPVTQVGCFRVIGLQCSIVQAACCRPGPIVMPLPATMFWGKSQVMTHADVAYFQGRLDKRQRLRAMAMQLETVQLISAGGFQGWRG